MNYNELKQKAEIERKAAKIGEALEIYLKIITLPEANDWDFYFCALLEHQSKKFAQSLEICRKRYAVNPNFLPLNNLFAQNIVYIVFYAPQWFDLQQLTDNYKTVAKLLDPKNSFMTIEKAYYYLLRRLNMNQKPQTVIDFTEQNSITDQDFALSEGQKTQKIIYPSVGETFLVERIKAFFALKRFNEVVAATDEALQKVQHFCYNNNIWIQRLKAQAFIKLGDPKAAMITMFEILNRKEEWFLDFEIAQILNVLGKKQACEYFILKALAFRQEAKYKPHLFVFLLENEYLENLTYLTAQTLAAINVEMKKEIPFAAKKYLHENDTIADAETKNKELTKEAKKMLDGMKHKATITKVFSPKNGFLRCQDKDYFYKNTTKEKLEAGMTVECSEAWDWNTKKQELGLIMKI